ncbi:MAG TPA: hypothetical protein VHB25_03350 [Gemmatimonadaceae bacterium]|nr:hypothetical protein [Gemmatimonadaceae bacterium]
MSIPEIPPPAGRARARARTRAALLLAVVFVAGGLAGAAIDRAVTTRAMAGGPVVQIAYQPKTGAPHAGPAAVDIPYAVQQLDLTGDQRTRIIAIVQQVRPESDSLWAQLRTEVVPKSRALETRMFQRILCTLTPAQRETWRTQMLAQAFDTAVVNERLRPAREERCAELP